MIVVIIRISYEMNEDESCPEIKLTLCVHFVPVLSIINQLQPEMISTPYPSMEEDDDWLDDSGPNQGGATDPLTNVEYDRIASKYSDVRPLSSNSNLFTLRREGADVRLDIGRVSPMGN
jgi:hypothetical protein